MTQTAIFPPGTPTLSGVVSRQTVHGLEPIAGVFVARGLSSGWRETKTDADGFYELRGLQDGTDVVHVSKAGYKTQETTWTITGDTRLDVQLRPTE